jgi:hypothetical protein
MKEAILTRQHLLAAEAVCTGRAMMAQWARTSQVWTMENL